MYKLERTQEEIEDLFERCDKLIERGSKYPGMSYEEGIKDALEWIINCCEPNPLEDDE